MVSETNLEQFREVTPEGRFTLQNSAMLKVRLENDQIQAKLGSMVAYQGDVRFEHKSGGLGRFFKKAVTGEGVKLMAANGTGDLFLAMDKRKIMILDLQNERMTVNGDNILAFESGIDWDIKRVEGAGRLAGGLFNVVLEGAGKVAVTSDGEPVLLDTSTPTFADPESAIAWSGGVRTGVRSDVSFKTFTGRGSGESFQVSFEGAGWVLIQPSEGGVVPEHSHAGDGGGGTGLLLRGLAGRTATATGEGRMDAQGSQPRRDGRATGATLPRRAFRRSKRRRGIHRAPRGIRHGDAPVRGAHTGAAEKMRTVPGGLPHSPDHSPAIGVVVREGLWIVEGVNDYGEGRSSTSWSSSSSSDGKIWRDTRYYAEPFEAPEWRAIGRADGILTRAASVFGQFAKTAPTGLCEAVSTSIVSTSRGTLHSLRISYVQYRGLL